MFILSELHDLTEAFSVYRAMTLSYLQSVIAGTYINRSRDS